MIHASDLNPETLKRLGLKPKDTGGKYHVSRKDQRTWNGRTYASKAEMNRARHLAMMLKAGLITDLEEQVRYPLEANGLRIGTYIADFRYKNCGAVVVEDAKGVRTPIYQRSKRHMKAQYGIDIHEV